MIIYVTKYTNKRIKYYKNNKIIIIKERKRALNIHKGREKKPQNCMKKKADSVVRSESHIPGGPWGRDTVGNPKLMAKRDSSSSTLRPDHSLHVPLTQLRIVDCPWSSDCVSRGEQNKEILSGHSNRGRQQSHLPRELTVKYWAALEPEIWGQDQRSGILRWLGSGKEVQRDMALPLRASSGSQLRIITSAKPPGQLSFRHSLHSEAPGLATTLHLSSGISDTQEVWEVRR